MLQAVIAGPAQILFQLMGIAVVGWVLELIASSVGKGHIASLIKTTATFAGLGLVITHVVGTIGKVGKAVGF